MSVPNSGILGGDNITQGDFKTEIENLRDAVAGGYTTYSPVNFIADADLTLTAAQNANNFIEITDTNPFLTQARNVIINEEPRIFVVKNSSGYAQTVKTAAGAGVSIADTATSIVRCDGTDMFIDNYTKSEIDTRVHNATSKTTPVDADELALQDSAASYGLKKLTWANLKATLKIYFDTLYVNLTSQQLTIGGKKGFSNTVGFSKGGDIASAAALPIGSDGNYWDVTGTTTITSINTTGKVGTIIKLHFDGILTLTHNATDLILPGGANITTAAGDEAEFIEYATGDFRCTSYTKADGTALVVSSSTISGVRQTVQTSSVDANGQPNFISAGTGLAVDIAATTTPVTIHSSNGTVSNDRIGTISADTSISGLTDATTNYLYAEVDGAGAVTLGSTALAPVYQFGGTYSITSGQSTFNISEMTMKVGDGATANQAYRVFIGEAITSGGVVTSVVNYALNGIYDSGYTATLPSANTITSRNHNIGIEPLKREMILRCTTAEFGYAIGDTITRWMGLDAGSRYGTNSIVATKNTVYTKSYNSNNYDVLRNDASTSAVLTLANWEYKFTAERGW